MAMQECKRAILGKALEDLVARARSGKEPCRIGLMASGVEHSDAEFLAAASAAMSADPALTVVGVGPKPSGILPQGMDWIETGCEGPELASGMENALAQGHIHGAVALHYPLPPRRDHRRARADAGHGQAPVHGILHGHERGPQARGYAAQRDTGRGCSQGVGHNLPLGGRAQP